MKIDLHTHCKPVSICAHHRYDEIPQMIKDAGLDAFVLTNHYFAKHCDKLSDDLHEQACIYVDVFRKCKEIGEKIGIKVFFGAEARLMDVNPHKPEFLLYGISEEEFIDSFPIYGFNQKELFDYCNEKNILMIQAHPYRYEQNYAPADMRYVHGVEVYNGNSGFENRFEDSLKLAIDNNLIKTGGSDFHNKIHAGAGMIVPDYIEDQFMLRDYLKTRECVIFDKSGIIYEEK